MKKNCNTQSLNPRYQAKMLIYLLMLMLLTSPSFQIACNVTNCHKCFPDSESCVSCNAGYNIVNSTVCGTTCNTGDMLFDIGLPYSSKCFSDCQFALYKCSKCTTLGACDECMPGSFRLRGDCFDHCPGSYYADSDDVCQFCHRDCFTCTGPLKTDCTGCYPRIDLTEDGECIAPALCPPGLFYKDLECVECNEEDDQRFQSPALCTNHFCPINHVRIGKECQKPTVGKVYRHPTWMSNFNSIKPNEYYDSIIGIKTCHKNCKTCGYGNKFCLTCNESTKIGPFPVKIFKKNRSCEIVCGLKYYEVKGICVKCHTSCVRCNILGCLSCESGKKLEDNECVEDSIPQCLSNQYEVDTGCLPCHNSCKTCSGPLDDDCISCNSGKFLRNSLLGQFCTSSCPDGLYPLDGECEYCHSNCTKCSSENSCSECLEVIGQPLFNKCGQQCPLGLYYDSVSCKFCHLDCGSCDGPDSDSCTGCRYGLILLNGYCQEKCPYGQVLKEGILVRVTEDDCDWCPEGSYYLFDSCIDSVVHKTYEGENRVLKLCYHEFPGLIGVPKELCFQCSFKLVLENDICLHNCTSPMTHKEDHICRLYCHENCLTCDNVTENDCLSCHQDGDLIYLHQKTCVQECPSLGFYHGNLNICEPCHASCRSCSGPDANQCLDCKPTPAPLIYFIDNTCIATCPALHYADFGLVCRKCFETCLTCNGIYKISCLTCDHGSTTPFYHQQECLEECPPKLFPSPTKICLDCHSTCEECNGISSTQCLKCEDGKFLKNGSCIPACGLGFYQNTVTNTCDPCTLNCDVCNTTQCTKCQSGKKLEQGVCKASCSSNYYESSTDVCTNCHYTCSTCSGSNFYQCSTCSSGKVLQVGRCRSYCSTSQYYKSGTNCLRCNNSCLRCTGPSASQCTYCSSSRYLLNNQCLTECGERYYENSSTRSCISCSTNCLQCTASGCTQCEPTKKLASGICTTSCPTDHYEFTPLECKKCHSTCETCNGSLPSNCLTCSSGKFFKNGGCVSSCGTQYYAQGIYCLQCDLACFTCSGPANNQCTGCDSSTFLKDSQCHSSCGNQYFSNTSNRRCEACSSNCLTCSGSECLQCFNSKFLEVGLCKNSCSSNFFISSPQVCTKCHNSCATCDGSGAQDCLTCPAGKVRNFDGSCIDNCPQRYFAEGVQCVSCDPNCLTCNGRDSDNCSSCDQTSSTLSALFNQECIEFCPALHYKKPDGTCTACDNSCASCDGTSASDCLSCGSGKFFKDRVCESNCGQGFFMNTVTNNCDPCSANCLACSDGLGSSCTLCGNGKKLENSVCKDSCTAMFYESSNGVCSSCDSSCASCSGPSPSQCLSCPTGTLLKDGVCMDSCGLNFFRQGSDCVACDPTCLTCSAVGSSNCLSCDSGRFFKSNVCLEDCGPTFFSNPSSNNCDACTENCQVCNGQFCTECSSTTNLEQGVCRADGCSSNFFMGPDQTCLPCHFTCATCTAAASFNCLTCRPDRIFHQESCPKECPAPYYRPEVDSKVCAKCPDLNVVFEEKCVSECPIGYVETKDRGCVRCGKLQVWFRKKCWNFCPPREQITKTDPVYPLASECNKQCALGFYHDKETEECLKCPEECSTCEVGKDSEPVCTTRKLQILYKDYKPLDQILEVKFQNKISEDNIDSLVFTLEDRPIPVKSIRIENEYKLVARLVLKETEVNHKILKINMLKGLVISSQDKTETYINFPIELKTRFYITGYEGQIESSEMPMMAATAGIGAARLGSDPSSSFKLQKMMQSLRFLGLVNVELPLIVSSFTKTLDPSKSNIFSFVVDVNEEAYNCNLPQKIRDNKLSCIGLNNTSMEVSILFFLFLLKLVIGIPTFLIELYLSSKIKKSKNEKMSVKQLPLILRAVYLVSGKLNSIITLSLIIPLANSLSFKLLIGNWNLIYSLHTLQAFNIISLIIFVFILMYNVAFLLLSSYFAYYLYKQNKLGNGTVKKGELEDKQENKKKNTLVSIFSVMFNLSRTKNIFYAFFLTVEDLLLSIVLIFGQSVPLVQISVLWMLYWIKLGFMIGMRPLRTLKHNILEILNTAFQIIIVTLFGGIYFLQNTITEKQKTVFIGIPILVALVLIVIINHIIELFYVLYTTYWKIRNYFNKKGKNSNKIKDKNLNESQIGINDSKPKVDPKQISKLPPLRTNDQMLNKKSSFKGLNRRSRNSNRLRSKKKDFKISEADFENGVFGQMMKQTKKNQFLSITDSPFRRFLVVDNIQMITERLKIN